MSASGGWSNVLASSVPSAETESAAEQEEVAQNWGHADDEVSQADAVVAPVEAQSLLHLSPVRVKPKKRGRPEHKLKSLIVAHERQAGEIVVPRIECAGLVFAVVGTDDAAKPSVSDVSVRVEPKDAVVRAPKKGRMTLPSILGTLLELQRRGGVANADSMDAVVLDAAKYYLDAGAYRVASQRVMESFLNAAPGSLQVKLNRLSCSILLQMYYARNLLEQQVTHALHCPSLVCYQDSSTYDETPMKLRLHDLAVGSSTSGDALGRVDVPFQSVATASGETLIAKVLQVHSTASMLLRLSERYVGLSLYVPSFLQSMSRTKGECLSQCIAKHSGVSHSADAFKTKLRTVSCDAAGSNLRGEELLLQQRPGWNSCVFLCDIHALASIHGKCFEGLDGALISGMMHFSLAMQTYHSWHHFKQCFIDELCSRPLQVIDESIYPSKANEQKLVLLQLLYGQCSSELGRCVELLSAFNGDWSLMDKLQYVWDHQKGPPPSAESIKSMMIDAANATLLRAKPRLWPRHRWTGFLESCASMGLLMACHGLVFGAYTRFLGVPSGASASIAKLEPSGILDGGQLSSLDLRAVLEKDSARQATTDIFGSTPLEGIGGEAAGTSTYAALHAKDKRIAEEFFKSHPWPRLLLCIVGLQPLNHLLSKHFELSGLGWQREQETQAMTSRLQGKQVCRKYRLQIAATLELEQNFFKGLDSLFNDASVFALMPTAWCTMQMRAYGFKLLSRIGALVECTLAARHRRWPIKMFSILGDSSLGPTLASEPDCVRDKYSKHLLSLYPNFLGEECLAVLAMQASEQKLDVAMVESLHASIRRQVMLKSCQTWTAGLRQISCEWLLQCYRHYGVKFQAKVKPTKVVKVMVSAKSS
eukprot:6491941-Amphidinium_carterae.1